MTELRRLSVDDIDEIKSLFRDIFTSEPWNDDWSDDGQLEGYIIELGIKPECQGRGLGTEFLRMIEEYIHANGISCIFLQTERDMPAYDFYRKNGFDLLDGHVSLTKFLK